MQPAVNFNLSDVGPWFKKKEHLGQRLEKRNADKNQRSYDITVYHS